jgi:hypothetical protein
MRSTPHNRLRTLAAGALVMALGTLGLTAQTSAASTGGPAPIAPPPGKLAVQYRTGGTAATASQTSPWLKIRNTGTSAVPLSGVTVRYYFKADPGATAGYRFACDWAVKGCANITGTFGTPARPTATSDRYLEIGFTAGAGLLQPGADTGDLQIRFHRADWGQLVQSDDHSFDPSQSVYGDWSRITARIHNVPVWGVEPGSMVVDPPPAATLFDDFAYTAHDDPRLAANGWVPRVYGGGPGVAGATWAPQNVKFGTDGASSVMKLETSTSGTPETTRHAELTTAAMKFKNGTYAARVRFSDDPVQGPDGDRVVQTFYAINDLKAPMADDYAEYDFEYLPNGGWGETGNTLHTTSWETYNPAPWHAVNQNTVDRSSKAGWRDLVLTIDGSSIRYYVDGQLFSTHDAAYLPERPMLISFNQWLIDLAGVAGTESRTYEQQVDYVLHVKDHVLTPAQVADRVAYFRNSGKTFEDTVPAV